MIPTHVVVASLANLMHNAQNATETAYTYDPMIEVDSVVASLIGLAIVVILIKLGEK